MNQTDSTRLITCVHRRLNGITHVVLSGRQVRDSDFNLADYCRRTAERMEREGLHELACQVPLGEESWSFPVTLAFIDDIGNDAELTAWLRERLAGARAVALRRKGMRWQPTTSTPR